MSYYNVWCGKSPRLYFIYTYQDRSLTCPIQATGDSMGNCVPHSGRVYHYSKAIQSNNVTRCKLLVVLKQGRDKYSKDCNTAGDVHRWLTVFQNRGCSMENSAGIYCFHGKADPDSSLSQIANMQHTRRCTRHRGVLMPECPSQWGCPVKSLGMSALLCFYTQVERWIWS